MTTMFSPLTYDAHKDNQLSSCRPQDVVAATPHCEEVFLRLTVAKLSVRGLINIDEAL